MLSSKDYANMTLEALVSEEKRMQSQKTTTAVLIGVVIGIAIYAATHKGFLLTVMLLVIAFWFGNKQSQDLKNIQAEISRRNA